MIKSRSCDGRLLGYAWVTREVCQIVAMELELTRPCRKLEDQIKMVISETWNEDVELISLAESCPMTGSCEHVSNTSSPIQAE
jgi:hypothetical protein